MATADIQWYTTGLDKITNVGGGFVWASADVRVLLVTSSYTFSRAHNDVADITNELTGGGYGRQVLTGMARTKNTTDDRIDYTADLVVFPTLGLAAGTPAKAIIFDHAGGADANRELICAITLTATPPNGSDYTVAWPSDLLAYIGHTATYTP